MLKNRSRYIGPELNQTLATYVGFHGNTIINVCYLIKKAFPKWDNLSLSYQYNIQEYITEMLNKIIEEEKEYEKNKIHGLIKDIQDNEGIDKLSEKSCWLIKRVIKENIKLRKELSNYNDAATIIAGYPCTDIKQYIH